MIGRFSDTSVYKEIFKSSDFIRIMIGGAFIPLGFYFSSLGILRPEILSSIPKSFTILNLFLILSIAINGLPIIIEAFKGLVARELNVDELVSMAIIACILTGSYFEAALVSFIMVLGAFFEEVVSDSARGAIESLVKVNPECALIENKDKLVETRLENVKTGDIAIIKAGETIPVDGIIVKGSGSIDESLLTGEALPVFKKTGDLISSGTLNLDGFIKIKVTKTAENSTLAKIIELVENAENSKIKATKVVDEYAGYFTPVILAIAVFTYIFTKNINNAITVLVVGCPCSFLLAGPVSTIAAVARAAKSGVMVKGGIYLEKLADSETIFFDKTGTITIGKPVIREIKPVKGYKINDVIKLASALENGSTHPIAEAIMDKAFELGIENRAGDDIKIIPGTGIKGKLDGSLVEVIAGETDSDSGDTIVLVLSDGKPVGEILLFDEMRPEIPKLVTSLSSLGIKEMGMISGDLKGPVKQTAHKAGINRYHFRCSPLDKMNLINDSKGRFPVFIGDGINDAPALKASSVGISMGLKGSETALETSDIVLMNDNISLLPFIIKLSRKMKKIIKFNLMVSLMINFVAIILSTMGLLTPVAGAVAHNIGSLFVVILSASIVLTREEENLGIGDNEYIVGFNN